MFSNAYCFSPKVEYLRGMRERQSSVMTKVLCSQSYNYSYPIASRTGRREARQAGRKLAKLPRQIETTSQISGPLGSDKKSRPTLTINLTSKSPTALLTGQAASVASAHPSTPI